MSLGAGMEKAMKGVRGLDYHSDIIDQNIMFSRSRDPANENFEIWLKVFQPLHTQILQNC